MKWDLFVKSFITNEGYKMMLTGLQNTVIIAVSGLILGFLIGCLIAVVRVVPNRNPFIKILNWISSIYVGFFRGTPIVVQLLVVYYILFPALGIMVNATVVACIAFGMNSGAYMSEIMRGGILSVDKGQLEAARSLGLSYGRGMMSVVLPQAFKNILPTVGNEFIALIKETSVVSFIAVVDLTKAFQSIASANYEFIVPYLMLALCYLVIVFIISILIKLLERRLRRSERRN